MNKFGGPNNMTLGKEEVNRNQIKTLLKSYAIVPFRPEQKPVITEEYVLAAAAISKLNVHKF